ncbi:MAG: hypothetical protein WBD53_17620 [Xanthobacteraceae bacterium]
MRLPTSSPWPTGPSSRARTAVSNRPIRVKPLYTFYNDGDPGDAKGDGVNNAWHRGAERTEAAPHFS